MRLHLGCRPVVHDMQIQPYSKDILPQALRLSAQSDSTPRTMVTWEGNHIQGVFAFEGLEPVGMIPLEPRDFKINARTSIPVLWVTGAHVQESKRSLGIGAKMDGQIAACYPQARAVMAYRQDEGSRAWLWYKRQGYKPLCLIHAYRHPVTSSTRKATYTLHEGFDQIKQAEGDIYPFFERWMKDYAGFKRRTPRFWSHTATHHYYLAYYQYGLICCQGPNGLRGYVFFGITAMRDAVKRLEVLEMVTQPTQADRDAMMEAVFDVARQKQLAEVRVQCCEHDELRAYLENKGFMLRWQTYIIGKELEPHSLDPMDVHSWKYFQVDYI